MVPDASLAESMCVHETGCAFSEESSNSPVLSGTSSFGEAVKPSLIEVLLRSQDQAQFDKASSSESSLLRSFNNSPVKEVSKSEL